MFCHFVDTSVNFALASDLQRAFAARALLSVYDISYSAKLMYRSEWHMEGFKKAERQGLEQTRSADLPVVIRSKKAAIGCMGPMKS